MKVMLPLKSFSFFKVFVGTIFLAIALISPLVALYSFLIALLVGKAHSFGAWLAMWKAQKLTVKYVAWMCLLMIVITYWGFTMVSLATLSFITGIMFAFHFLFDEFDLQEVKRSAANVLSVITPALILATFLIVDYLHFKIDFSIFVIATLIMFAIELIFLEEVNWFFVQTKVITLFTLLSIYLGSRGSTIIGVFLTFHYFFWFIYPVYKLHKYKREERDGFIMILLLIVAGAVFSGLTLPSYGDQIIDYATKIFLTGTIVHILSTAPFGYFFGLPRPKVYS